MSITPRVVRLQASDLHPPCLPISWGSTPRTSAQENPDNLWSIFLHRLVDFMSWLKQPSSSSLKESASRPKTATNASQSSSSANRNAQNTVTRILACGTVYLTHTLSVPSSIIDPSGQDAEDVPSDLPGSAKTTSVRAKQVSTQRGGPAVNILSILAQFSNPSLRPPTTPNRPSANSAQVHKPVIECALVSPLGSDAAGRALMHELELEGVRTRFCKVHPAGVPSAFVLRSGKSLYPITCLISYLHTLRRYHAN